MKAHRIDGTSFGSITIDGEEILHDVLIRMSGKVKKRKKKLSKRVYGTSHIVSIAEADHVYEKGLERLILGTGQEDSVRLSKEAREFFKKKGVKLTLEPTPKALLTFNKAKGRKAGLFHVTC